MDRAEQAREVAAGQELAPRAGKGEGAPDAGLEVVRDAEQVEAGGKAGG